MSHSNKGVQKATTTVPGIVELATDEEARLLVDEEKVLTPSNISAILEVQKNSGFQEWTGSGSYYTISSTDFTLDRPGIGWINNAKVTWLGNQTVSSLGAGETHYIYIDSTGTIGSSSTRSDSLFQENIVLFQVLVDSAGTPNVIVVKENHHISTNPATMNALHHLGMSGYDVAGSVGGTISLNGTVGIQIDGNTDWHDHDLETQIPDSGAAAVNLEIMYTNGAGKWVRDATQNTLPTEYNNAGTPTSLAGNERGIFEIRVSKDDLESAAPKYFAIMNDSVYANLAQAELAVVLSTFSTATNELAEIETIRMGVVIINATQIDIVTVDKQTIGTGSISSVGSSASSVSTDTTNFDGWLSASDTTVQSSLETLDELGKAIEVDSEGIVSMPLQSSFYAYSSSTQSNATGNGTEATVIFGTEVFDQNSDYNNATGIFTVPVTGIYFIQSGIRFEDLDAGVTTMQMRFHVNGTTEHLCEYGDPRNWEDGSGISVKEIFKTLKLTSGDTVEVVVVGGGSGSDNVDIVSSAENTWFSIRKFP